jgi:hypothetical protein
LDGDDVEAPKQAALLTTPPPFVPSSSFYHPTANFASSKEGEGRLESCSLVTCASYAVDEIALTCICDQLAKHSFHPEMRIE